MRAALRRIVVGDGHRFAEGTGLEAIGGDALVDQVVADAVRSPLRQPHVVGIGANGVGVSFDDHLGVDTHLRFPQTQALLAGATTPLTAGVLCYLLLRNTDPGQIVCALLVSFTVGGLAGHLIFPQTNPIGILFSPAVVAVVGYTWVMLRFGQTDAVVSAWHRGQLPGMALALPVHYASAAIAGCAIGVGWAQGIIHGNRELPHLTGNDAAASN